MEGRGGAVGWATGRRPVTVAGEIPGQEGENGRLVRSCGRFLGFLAKKLENRTVCESSSSKRVVRVSVRQTDNVR